MPFCHGRRPLDGEGTLDTMIRLFQTAANGAGSPRSQLQQQTAAVAKFDIDTPALEQHVDESNRGKVNDELD